MMTDPIELAGLWDTRIEVIDKREAEVVATGLVPESVAFFLDDSHVLGSRPVEGGWIISIWRVTLPSTDSPAGFDGRQ